jgi:hypothetical protein
MEKYEIILETENNQGTVKFLLNGQPLPSIFQLDFHFNSRQNELKFTGKRFLTDKAGQFYVDEETKDTAMEEINMLDLLDRTVREREMVEEYEKAIEFGLLNIYKTSIFNAEKLIKEENCELRKAG